MATAKNGDTVKVHYTGRLTDGTVFDTSAERDPMEFTLGEGNLIPGFEDAVVGMAPGQEKSVQIACDQAYGPRHQEMIQTIERQQIPENLTLEVGRQLMVPHESGQSLILTIVDVTDAEVTVDGNHPLAGEDLTFDIELMEIV